MVRGDEDVTFKTLDSVQVSLKLATTVSDFYDKGGTQTFISNVAYSLGIPSSRIRIVDVRSAGRRLAMMRRSGMRRLAAAAGMEVDFAIVEEEPSPPPPAPPAPPLPPPAPLGTPSPPPSPPPPSAVYLAGIAAAEAAAALAQAEAKSAELQRLATSVSEKAGENTLFVGNGSEASSSSALFVVDSVEVAIDVVGRCKLTLSNLC